MSNSFYIVGLITAHFDLKWTCETALSATENSSTTHLICIKYEKNKQMLILNNTSVSLHGKEMLL